MEITKNVELQIETIKERCLEIKPFVVIRCITYNHEQFIRDALNGFVMQKTSFPFVAIVHDDASTDDTKEIISEYAIKYPDIILPIYEEENQYSKHNGSVGRVINSACDASGAKYIALCEGDDYWTDPLKLQIQVDFLECHHEYAFACHRFNVFDERTKEWHKEYCYQLYKNNKDIDIDIKLFLKYWITQPLTTVIRKSSWDGYNAFRAQFKYSRDVHLFYYLLSKGKGISLNNNMGVYRWHDGGIAIGLDKKNRIITNYNVFKELYYATKDKRLFKIYFNYLISYYLIEDDQGKKKELYFQATKITSYMSVSINLLKRKIRVLLTRYGFFKK